MGEHITLDQAVQRRITLRDGGKKLVFTNGHFDLLHVGHLDYLEKARALGDALFVGVNGDASTRRLKGEGRPIVPALERARLLAALIPVTAAIIFEADTANSLIEALKPEIYVKGGDYAVHGSHPKPLPERATVESYGGRVVLIDYMPGHSTSELIARIKSLP
jgi:D-glycero-beta-D-manno-heptose 1-phosphate adenylyltransferase